MLEFDAWKLALHGLGLGVKDGLQHFARCGEARQYEIVGHERIN